MDMTGASPYPPRSVALGTCPPAYRYVTSRVRRSSERIVAVAPPRFTPGGELAHLTEIAAAGAGAYILLVVQVAGVVGNSTLTGIAQGWLARSLHEWVW